MTRTTCPGCGRLWLHTSQGEGCLTQGCVHTLRRPEPKPKKSKAKPKDKP
jgi:hypothetical protein